MFQSIRDIPSHVVKNEACGLGTTAPSPKAALFLENEVGREESAAQRRKHPPKNHPSDLTDNKASSRFEPAIKQVHGFEQITVMASAPSEDMVKAISGIDRVVSLVRDGRLAEIRGDDLHLR